MDVIEYGIRPPNHRLPNETRLGRVRLQIADISRSIAYYERVVGMRVIDRSAARADLGTQDGATVLVELHEKPGVNPVPRRGRVGLYHYAILLPERAALGRFVKHLADIGEYAGMSDHFVSEAIYLQDPDGLGIEVYADRPRTAWKHIDRQLSMSTDPLDVPSLVAAAKGERWTGMPAGTVIGHVHLHVKDLAKAAELYHAALGFDRVVG